MRLLGGGIVPGMARARGQAAKSKTTQHITNAALRQMNAEAHLDHPRQIDPAPTDNTVFRNRGSLLDESGDLGLLLNREASCGSRRHTV